MDSSTPDRVAGYAQAVLAVARAEGTQPTIEAELARVAEALRASDHLQSVLADRDIEVERRLQIVEDLIGDRALPATVALVSMVVGSGRAEELLDVIDESIRRAAESRGHRVARVRSAVELTSRQRSALVAALEASSGFDIEIQTTVDSAVIGGVVTEIGDDVIDGSVRRRLQQMRSGLS